MTGELASQGITMHERKCKTTRPYDPDFPHEVSKPSNNNKSGVTAGDAPMKDSSRLESGVLEKDTVHVRAVEPLSELCSISAGVSNGSNTSTGLVYHAGPSIWSPSILRIGPLIGLGALVLGLCQIVAAYAVLKASDGEPTVNWQYQPTVYLAVLTAISNKALSFAFVQGAVVTWWRKAIRRNGTTLADMHRDWSYGSHVYKAITAGRNFSILALACICATLVAIDGPLLQRASSVRLVVLTRPTTLDVFLAPEVPSGFSGFTTSNASGETGAALARGFEPVAQGYVEREPITNLGVVQGCKGRCAATVLAPAVQVSNCISWTEYRNYLAPLTKLDDTIYNDTGSATQNRSALYIQFYVAEGEMEHIVLHTILSGEEVAETCAGEVNFTNCYFAPAIGEYSIIVDGTSIVLPPQSPKIIATANNTALTEWPADGYAQTTLAGVAVAAGIQMASDYAFVPENTTGHWKVVQVPSANAFAASLYGKEVAQQCASSWKDPYEKIVGGLNEIMFRTGVFVSQQYDETWLRSRLDPDVDVNYTVSGTPLSETNVFHSDFSYFGAAAAIELATIFIILVTFHGYWHIGRPCSMSPLEISKAFEAPLLRNVHEQSGKRIAESQRDHRVRYEYSSDEHVGRLVVIDDRGVKAAE